MHHVGKYLRMRRILNSKTNRTVIVPLDHGGYGIVEGLENLEEVVKKIVAGGANAIILQAGALKVTYKALDSNVGVIMRISSLSAFNSDFGFVEAVTHTLEEALMMGVDAVITSLHVGGKYEFESLRNTGLVCEACDKWGVPCVVETYPSRDKFKRVDDPEVIIQVMRIAEEIGADIIKAYLPLDPDFMKKASRVVHVPVVLAGGEAATPREVLHMAKIAVEAGLAGVCFGRKVFKYKDPEAMVKALVAIVHENASVEEALKLLPEH